MTGDTNTPDAPLVMPPWPVQVAVHCRRCGQSVGYHDLAAAEDVEESTEAGCEWCLADCPVCGDFGHEDPTRLAPVCAECIEVAHDEMRTAMSTRVTAPTVEAFDQRWREHRWALHNSGVHVECRSSSSKFASEIDRCRYAGAVERVHAHDFDGPLWAACGCEELGQ